LYAIEAAAPGERIFLNPAAQSAQVELPPDVPVAGLDLRSIVRLGGGRYSLEGVALDSDGNAACALALASGRCMFTCGEGSLRCEGGTDSLPFGHFELIDLPTEADGTINLQIFVQGEVSRANAVYPEGVPSNQAGWGVANLLPCPDSASTFSATIDQVSKRSVLSNPDGESSWEGWSAVSPGQKAITAAQFASGCGSFQVGFSGELLAGRCYLFVSELSDTGEPAVGALELDCDALP
jgi:hypothetical protein